MFDIYLVQYDGPGSQLLPCRGLEGISTVVNPLFPGGGSDVPGLLQHLLSLLGPLPAFACVDWGQLIEITCKKSTGWMECLIPLRLQGMVCC
jgi:hypothetical protein